MQTLPVTRRATQFATRVVRGLESHGALEAAAAIAFWFFLSLVPLLVLLGFLVGRVARARGVDALVTPMLEVVPEAAEDIVRSEITRLTGSTATLAPLGVIGFFWTSSSGLHNLMDVFEAAARVHRRSWWKQRLLALGWVVAGLATACALAWALMQADAMLHARDPGDRSPSAQVSPGAPPGRASASSSAASRTAEPGAPRGTPIGRARGALKVRMHAAIHTPLEQAIASGLMLTLGLLFLGGFYRFAVVHPPGVARRVWPGALTAIGSWLVVSWGFGLYVVTMPSYAAYYGSLAAVAVMMVWLYLTSLSLVVGAEVNAKLEEVPAGPP